MKKRALITGITGQDGSYLAELLLEHGGEVRRVAFEDPSRSLWRLRDSTDEITLHAASLESYAACFGWWQKTARTSVYTWLRRAL